MPTYGKVLYFFLAWFQLVSPIIQHSWRNQIEKEQNFPITFTLTSLAVHDCVDQCLVCNNCDQSYLNMYWWKNDFIIYGLFLFVIWWFTIITIFLISDCRKADERKRKKLSSCMWYSQWLFLFQACLSTSWPIITVLFHVCQVWTTMTYVMAVELSDLACYLIVLSAFLIPLTAFTGCCQLYLTCKYKKKNRNYLMVCDAEFLVEIYRQRICV